MAAPSERTQYRCYLIVDKLLLTDKLLHQLTTRMCVGNTDNLLCLHVRHPFDSSSISQRLPVYGDHPIISI